MDARKIHEALLNRKEKVCHRSEIVELIKEYKKKFRSTIRITDSVKYLSRHNYITRIFKGYYYLNSIDEQKRGYRSFEDRELLFIVLNKLKMGWYVGLSSAMHYSGKSWQVPSVTSIVNGDIAGEKNILGIKVRFSKLKKLSTDGLKKSKTRNNIPFYYSLPKKTASDTAYLKWYGKR